MLKILLVASGGAIGSVFRYLLSTATPKLFGSMLIIGTFSVNIIGSLLIGILWAFFENNSGYSEIKLFLLVGILGGFTTFSSFAIESINLFRNEDISIPLLYIFTTNILGLLAAYGGYFFFKQILTTS